MRGVGEAEGRGRVREGAWGCVRVREGACGCVRVREGACGCCEVVQGVQRLQRGCRGAAEGLQRGCDLGGPRHHVGVDHARVEVGGHAAAACNRV